MHDWLTCDVVATAGNIVRLARQDLQQVGGTVDITGSRTVNVTSGGACCIFNVSCGFMQVASLCGSRRGCECMRCVRRRRDLSPAPHAPQLIQISRWRWTLGPSVLRYTLTGARRSTSSTAVILPLPNTRCMHPVLWVQHIIPM